MKYALTTALLAGLAATSPVAVDKRQLGGITENDLEDGKCGDVIFLMARGSTEPGNMGISVGPPTCSALKRSLGDVICQGVGGAYRAQIATNALPRGTTSGSINEAIGLFERASTQCPDAVIVAAGYSQGAAVMNGAVQDLDPAIQEKVAGVVLYGSTRNLQTGGHIPDFPEEKSITYCQATDGVCFGALLVTPGHLTYIDDVPKAVDYLSERVEALGAATASASAAEIAQIAQEQGAVASLTPGTVLGGDDAAAQAAEEESTSGSSFGSFGWWNN